MIFYLFYWVSMSLEKKTFQWNLEHSLELSWISVKEIQIPFTPPSRSFLLSCRLIEKRKKNIFDPRDKLSERYLVLLSKLNGKKLKALEFERKTKIKVERVWKEFLASFQKIINSFLFFVRSGFFWLKANIVKEI